MLKSLRSRLILSHILPLIIIIPIMGILLLYALETRYFIPDLTRNLEGDARLIADLAGSHPEIWSDPALAQALLNRLDPDQAERVLLVTTWGYTLARTGPGGTNPSHPPELEVPIDAAVVKRALSGEVVTGRRTSPDRSADVIDITAPVLGPGGQPLGVVRISYYFATYYQEFYQLRFLIGSILFFGLVVGVSIALALALNIGKPIQDVTGAVYELSSGRRKELLPERGPEEIRQFQRAVNSLVERLRTMEATREVLLANLVHELGRPMGAMRAAIQALLRGAKSDPQLLDELLHGMDEEALRLEQLTEDLAELHDQMLGPLEMDFRKLSLSEWLPRVVLPWQEQAEQAGLHWEAALPPGLPEVSADADRLAQAVGNLVSNAIKYTPVGGKVSVSAGSDADWVWLCVGDTGPGIPIDEQEAIFTPFFRGAHARRFPSGMGLGLSITRDLVVAHGGRIELDSAPGLGSQFTIRLPKG